MVVGACRLTFAIPGDQSSKGVAHKIKDKLWSKFKISVAELETERTHQVVIGTAIVGINEQRTRERVDQMIRFFNDWGGAELVEDEIEVIQFEDIEVEREFAKYDP